MNIRYFGILFGLSFTAVILWTMLLPGYILTLDMVFTPYFHYMPQPGEVMNNAPLWYVLQLLYTFIPGWIIEKLMLFVLFFTMSYCSYTYLPVPKRMSVRLFAMVLYTANTFVYVRMLAGQWAILYAYALLPLFLYLLLESTKEVSYKKEVALGAVLALIGLFSIHIFVMSVLVTFAWWGYHKLRMIVLGDWKDYRRFITHGGLSFLTLLVLTSYWTIPALKHPPAFVSVFTSAHWEAFAAAPHGSVPTILNLVALGGFWAENRPWASYFIWPQTHPLFWIAFAGVLLLSLTGIATLWRRGRRDVAIFMSLVGVFAVIFGSGDAITPFQGINLFLYTHVSFWEGFRDSQKWIAMLALTYAVLAGYGFDAFVNLLDKSQTQFITTLRTRGLVPYVTALSFLIPIFFGMFMWGGFEKQLPNVSFPLSWASARAELITHPEDKALVLPWQGYFSLAFDRNLIVGNPAGQYFGAQAVVGQNVRLGKVYDQTYTDDAAGRSYEELDKAITENGPENGQTMAEFLKSRGITSVIYLQDLENSGVSRDNYTYDFLKSPDFTVSYSSKELVVYQIK